MITEKNKGFLAKFDHHLEDEHVDKLIADEDLSTRAAIATRPNLKDHQVDVLVNDRTYLVRGSIATNRLTWKPHHIDQLIKDVEFVRDSITENPNLKDHHIEKLVNDRDKLVHQRIKKNPLYQGYVARKQEEQK